MIDVALGVLVLATFAFAAYQLGRLAYSVAYTRGYEDAMAERLFVLRKVADEVAELTSVEPANGDIH